MTISFRSILWLSLCLTLTVCSTLTHGAPTFCGTLAIAHRGNSIAAPENTLAAISLTSGEAHIVEFDVRQCATGELVVIHDSTVDRTTDGTGLVADLSLAQLKSLDAGGWFSAEYVNERIPTLAEALLSLPSGVRPLIHRYTGSARKYLAELKALDIQGALIQSFSWEFLAEVRLLSEDIQLGALGTGVVTNEVLGAIKATGSDIVVWKSNAVDAMTIQLVHDAGLSLYVWTVNDIAGIEELVALGVEGVISDDPLLVFDQSTPWYIHGDFNMDGQVDLADHADFVECFAGPSHPTQERCGVFDVDCDGDLDLRDAAAVAGAF